MWWNLLVVLHNGFCKVGYIVTTIGLQREKKYLQHSHTLQLCRVTVSRLHLYVGIEWKCRGSLSLQALSHRLFLVPHHPYMMVVQRRSTDIAALGLCPNHTCILWIVGLMPVCVCTVCVFVVVVVWTVIVTSTDWFGQDARALGSVIPKIPNKTNLRNFEVCTWVNFVTGCDQLLKLSVLGEPHLVKSQLLSYYRSQDDRCRGLGRRNRTAGEGATHWKGGVVSCVGRIRTRIEVRVPDIYPHCKAGKNGMYVSPVHIEHAHESQQNDRHREG